MKNCHYCEWKDAFLVERKKEFIVPIATSFGRIFFRAKLEDRIEGEIELPQEDDAYNEWEPSLLCYSHQNIHQAAL